MYTISELLRVCERAVDYCPGSFFACIYSISDFAHQTRSERAIDVRVGQWEMENREKKPGGKLGPTVGELEDRRS